MSELDLIALKYGTDKSSKFHDYAEKYEFYFQSLKNKKLKILEIGVASGASLKMWKEYFPLAEIYGIDIYPDCKKLEEERIKIFIGNQSDQNFIKNLIAETGNFDIIIDDGGHISSEQIKSFELLFYHLNPDGFYIIEDLHTTYMKEYNDEKKINIMDFLKSKADDLQFNGKNINNWFLGNKEKHQDSLQNKVELNYFEQNIKYIHFYKSICFIAKY